MLTNHLTQLRHALAALLIGSTLVACSSTAFEAEEAASAARPAAAQAADDIACRAGDSVVASEAQCIQDAAACYQLPNGNWCTGSRASACPNGSEAVPSGQSCPSGAVCFPYAEGLQCMMKRS